MLPPGDQGPVPLRTYSDWPGIDQPGHVRVDRAKLKALATRLERHLEDLLAADGHLRLPDASAFGAWDAAQAFYPSVKTGHDALADQHSRVLHALMDMIKMLHRAAHTYDRTEAALERRIAAIDTRLHVASKNSLAGHDPSTAKTPDTGTTVANSLNPDARN